MENNQGSSAVPAAQENSKQEEQACFRRAAVAEDATFVEVAKEQLKQFTAAPMEDHWSCIKNKVRSVLGDNPFAGLGAKDGSTTKPTSVESQ